MALNQYHRQNPLHAGMKAAVFGNILTADDGVALVFFIVHAVADGDALGLEALHLAVLPAHIANTGIHQQMPSVGPAALSFS